MELPVSGTPPTTHEATSSLQPVLPISLKPLVQSLKRRSTLSSQIPTKYRSSGMKRRPWKVYLVMFLHQESVGLNSPPGGVLYLFTLVDLFSLIICART